MIADEIKPFHEQNQVKFDKLFGALNQLTGSINTAIVSAKIGGFIISTLIVLVGIGVTIGIAILHGK